MVEGGQQRGGWDRTAPSVLVWTALMVWAPGSSRGGSPGVGGFVQERPRR